MCRCLVGEWTPFGIHQLRLESEQLHGAVSQLCRTTSGQCPVLDPLPLLHQPHQLLESESVTSRDAIGVLHVYGDAMGRMWLLRADRWQSQYQRSSGCRYRLQIEIMHTENQNMIISVCGPGVLKRFSTNIFR